MRCDHGFATVWVVSAMGVVVVAAATAAGLGTAIVERHRAADAADAAALGAALHAIDGPAGACAAGAALAADNGARLMRCDMAGSFATVTVSVRLPGPLASFGVAVGEARAGPASATPT